MVSRVLIFLLFASFASALPNKLAPQVSESVQVSESAGYGSGSGSGSGFGSEYQAESANNQDNLRHDASDPKANEVISYWTAERMKDAKPLDMFGPDHFPQPDSKANSSGVSLEMLQTLLQNPSNSEWDNEWSGVIQNAVGRIFFRHGGQGRVCSGTVVKDVEADRSIILTAAHCVYDDQAKEFATNVMFIPNQAATSGSGTDYNCDNDPLGCWASSFGVVDVDWASRVFPANAPWDYAMYIVPASGAHSGPTNRADGTAIPDNLEEAAGSLPVVFETLPLVKTYALGYSYAHDPDFMYCAEQLSTQQSFNSLWIAGCGLTGGASGGPWIQGNVSSFKVVSINSWKFGSSLGMAAPRFDDTNAGHAADVFALAKCATFEDASSAKGVLWCPEMGSDPCASNVICGASIAPPPTLAPTMPITPSPSPANCVDRTLNNGSPWNDADGALYNCAWYGKPGNRCPKYGNDYANEGLVANQACCVCGGGATEEDLDCGEVAETTIQDIIVNVANSQKLLDDLANGCSCADLGQDEVRDASYQIELTTAALVVAEETVVNATNAMVLLGSQKFTMLYQAEGCDWIQDDAEYLAAAEAHQNAVSSVTIARIALNQTVEERHQAILNSERLRLECECTTKREHEREWIAATEGKDTRASSWTKSHQMKCVLAKKSYGADQCVFDEVPTVNRPELCAGVADADCDDVKVNGSPVVDTSTIKGQDGKF